jgi:hypothetical protein
VEKGSAIKTAGSDWQRGRPKVGKYLTALAANLLPRANLQNLEPTSGLAGAFKSFLKKVKKNLVSPSQPR